DSKHTGPRTKFDRELIAQGIGNTICGFFAALPMTGVIVRSAANVEAGAKSRVSTILHGVWLLLLVSLLPGVLGLIPTAALAVLAEGHAALGADRVRARGHHDRHLLRERIDGDLAHLLEPAQGLVERSAAALAADALDLEDPHDEVRRELAGEPGRHALGVLSVDRNRVGRTLRRPGDGAEDHGGHEDGAGGDGVLHAARSVPGRAW